MTTGDRIAQKRKENNLTQDELAYKLGVSRQAVSGWENGLNYPETEKLIAMGRLFGVSIDWLLNGGEERRADKTAFGKVTFDLSSVIPSYTSKKTVAGLPLVSVGKNAKGIVAVGLTARGVVAIGLLPVGLIAFGVLPLGLLAFGCAALGLLALGGIAFGVVALGGIAFGFLSLGGLSVGIGAIGGAAFGQFAFGGYANAEYLAIGDVAIGQIACGTTSASGSLFSYAGSDTYSVYEEICRILETSVPQHLVWLNNIFLGFLR